MLETQEIPLISYLFSMACICQLFAMGIYFVGLGALALFLYDNLKSAITIITAILEPYFQPQIPQNLVDKYGKWAGEIIVI